MDGEYGESLKELLIALVLLISNEQLFDKLEADKKSLSLDPKNDPFHIEGFAMGIFTRADKADRSGSANLAQTARAFNAASRFFEVPGTASSLFIGNIYIHTYIHTHTYIYIYLCVCVCAW